MCSARIYHVYIYTIYFIYLYLSLNKYMFKSVGLQRLEKKLFVNNSSITKVILSVGRD